MRDRVKDDSQRTRLKCLGRSSTIYTASPSPGKARIASRNALEKSGDARTLRARRGRNKEAGSRISGQELEGKRLVGKHDSSLQTVPEG